MDNVQPPTTPEDQEAFEALRDARTRFVAGFTQRLSAMATLLDNLDRGDEGPLVPLRESAHKLAGLGGMLGFPSVSEHAAALEQALLAEAPKLADARGAMQRMANGFTRDLSSAIPSWAHDAVQADRAARILVVEDDREQRRIAASGLRAAGYSVVTAESGTEAVEAARAERPDLILLDVDLPGLDGMAVCRQIKLDRTLASVPVIFCTARTGLMDRVAGLALGADDYISKPYAPSELLLRIRRLVARPVPAAPDATPGDNLLPFEQFAATARTALAAGPAAVVMVRVPAPDLVRAASRFVDDVRRRDILGRLSDTHIVVLTPGLSASVARSTIRAILDKAPRFDDAAIGAVDTPAVPPAGDALDAMVAEADLALAADRVGRGGNQPGKTTVLIAEDDPDVIHIVDARLRAAGYRTVLTLDGQQTLDALERESPAVILLDLMMPRLTGFDVLMRLRELPKPSRPRTIVVSARGRDEDVARAFELGADDYVTKPFNPEELMARIARLTR
jgi:DNA-binding response OmpR family regulator/HPt (histidine-containing phosphotransfer) domain-containing protein